MSIARFRFATALRIATLCGGALGALQAGAALAGDAPRPWLERNRAPAERADLIVAAMTADEKIRLLQGDMILDGNGTGVNPCVGHISGIARLGLPSLCMGDGPAGVGNGMCQRRSKSRPFGGVKPGHRVTCRGEWREGVARGPLPPALV